MIVDSGPRWPTLDPASLVSAVSAVRSAGVDVRSLLSSGRNVPADVFASLQNVDSGPCCLTVDPASLVSAVLAVCSALHYKHIRNINMLDLALEDIPKVFAEKWKSTSKVGRHESI